MQATDILKHSEDGMKKAVEATQKELKGVRTGRANPALLDNVVVEYYGSSVSLKQLANISTPDGKCLVIQPYDKGAIKDIETGINKADTGMTPSNDGNVIRLQVPILTEERRKEMVKVVHKIAEDGKISIRSARRDGIDQIKKIEKEKQISEDESKKQQEILQKLTDKYTKEIENISSDKEKEILSV